MLKVLYTIIVIILLCLVLDTLIGFVRSYGRLDLRWLYERIPEVFEVLKVFLSIPLVNLSYSTELFLRLSYLTEILGQAPGSPK